MIGVVQKQFRIRNSIERNNKGDRQHTLLLSGFSTLHNTYKWQQRDIELKNS